MNRSYHCRTRFAHQPGSGAWNTRSNQIKGGEEFCLRKVAGNDFVPHNAQCTILHANVQLYTYASNPLYGLILLHSTKCGRISKMSMITTTTWIRRGVAAAFPTKYELDEAEIDRISKLAKLQLEAAQEDLHAAKTEADGDNVSQSDQGSNININEASHPGPQE